MRWPLFNAGVTSILLAALLAGCGGGSPSRQASGQSDAAPANSGQIPAAPKGDPDAQNSALLAAAEPFENLTESAFAANPQQLNDLVAKAKAAADGVSGRLPLAAARTLSGHISDIVAAQASDNRADLAIASVEGYRTLASNASDRMKIPKQVSLLDYAGFRYQASLKAQPIRWADIASSIDFADGQWQAISKRVTDASLHKSMSDALAQMRTASQRKDAKTAASASTSELDLVDKLETFFDHA